MNIMKFILPKSLVEYIYTTNTVRQALEKMRYHHYVAIPVIDEEGNYVGTLRNDDILMYFLKNMSFDAREAEKTSVMDVMAENQQKPLYHNASVSELIDNVREHNFVPVVDDRGCFIGLILRRDILDFLVNYYQNHEDKK